MICRGIHKPMIAEENRVRCGTCGEYAMLPMGAIVRDGQVMVVNDMTGTRVNGVVEKVQHWTPEKRSFAVWINNERYSMPRPSPIPDLDVGDEVSLSYNKSADGQWNNMSVISRTKQKSVEEFKPEPKEEEAFTYKIRGVALERAIEFCGLFHSKEGLEKMNFDEKKQLVMQVAREFEEFLSEPSL